MLVVDNGKLIGIFTEHDVLLRMTDPRRRRANYSLSNRIMITFPDLPVKPLHELKKCNSMRCLQVRCLWEEMRADAAGDADEIRNSGDALASNGLARQEHNDADPKD